jgi:hypothetical protein
MSDSQGAHSAPARSGAGQGAPASDEPGFGAEPRQRMMYSFGIPAAEK